jgi:hypothetical protein
MKGGISVADVAPGGVEKRNWQVILTRVFVTKEWKTSLGFIDKSVPKPSSRNEFRGAKYWCSRKISAYPHCR